MRVLRWIWGATVSFMILAPATFTTGRAWAEPAQPPTDLAAVIQTDSDLLKEELKFLQEETVSIAVTHEQPISEAPSNVYVITAEDIRHSGAVDLPTLFRRIPGIEVIQMTGADFNVSARGNNQLRHNKMLVLLDGRSIYIDVQGEVLWKMLPVTLPEIKRIEVLKGPASHLYGFNAFDGVINIITKSPQEISGTTAQFGAGEFGTITASAIHAGNFEKLGYRLSFGEDQTNSWSQRDSLAFRAYKFNGQLEYLLPGDTKITGSGGYVDSNRYDGPLVDTVAVSQKPSQGYAHVVFEGRNFFIRSHWTEFNQPSFINPSPGLASVIQITDIDGQSRQNLTWNSYNLEGQHAIDISTRNRFTYGFNYRHNKVSSNFLSETTHENRLGFYAQDEWEIFDPLTIVAGLRFDMDTFINPTYSPRISLIYSPLRDHTFRANIAMAYRPPTIFETNTQSRGLTFSPFFPVPIESFLVGSDNLKPEQIISYELGYQGWYLKHRLRLRLDLFYNHISDLITNSQMVSPNTFTFRNGGEADIYGGEAGFEFLLTPWLSGFANYSFVEIGQVSIADGRGDRAAPRHKVNAGLRADFENGLNGEIAIHYVGQNRYPINSFFNTASNPPFTGQPPPDTLVNEYSLLNLRGGYRFWRVNGQERAEVAVTAFNALNDKHQEHPLGEIIKSRVMGWLTIRFP